MSRRGPLLVLAAATLGAPPARPRRLDLGLKETAVAVAATLILAEPLTAAMLGLLLLDEPARVSTVMGIGLIMAGLATLVDES